MSSSRPALVIALALAAFPVLAADTRQDGERETATAAYHAGMAIGAESPQMVKLHLQQVINCLEGPKGADYTDAVGNPCGGEGNGAIADTKEDGRRKLEDAAGLAKRAMGELNIDKARQMAAQIKSDLGK